MTLTDAQVEEFGRRLRRFQEADRTMSVPPNTPSDVAEYLVARDQFAAVTAAARHTLGLNDAPNPW